MKTGILFLSDETTIKEIIRNVVPLQDDFDIFFAESGEKGLQILANNKIDIFFGSPNITLPSGSNIFYEIKRVFPETIRFALVSNLESPSVAQLSQYVHQFVQPPYTLENLKERIERTSSLQKTLKNEKIKELVQNITALPSLPELYIQIEQEVARPDFSLSKIGNLIAKDPNLTAKILQIVNSAYFGLQREITNINFALSYLGVNVIKSLIFYIHLFSNFKVTPENRKYLEQFWKHSLIVASNTYHLAEKHLTSKSEIDSAYTAGVLHDVGKFVLLNTYTYPQNVMLLAEQKAMDNLEAENEIYQCTHAEIGAYLLGLWGFPITIVEAVAYHHQPSKLKKSSLNFSTILHIADFLYYTPNLDVPHIQEIGLEKDLIEAIYYFKNLRLLRRK
ncbi:MAG: HDOD domain-containing protein [Candidatus Kapaibacteriota bacterium]|jgi:HD-like signal output (HDOD) protein